MDVRNSNGDHTLSLVAVTNDVPTLNASAIDSIWKDSPDTTLPKDSMTTPLESLPELPSAISTPQPTPNKVQPEADNTVISAEETPLVRPPSSPQSPAETNDHCSLPPPDIITDNNGEVPPITDNNVDSIVNNTDINRDQLLMEVMSHVHVHDKTVTPVPLMSAPNSVPVSSSPPLIPVTSEDGHYSREITPSLLTANEEMLSDDEDEDVMDTQHSPNEPIVNSSKDSAIVQDSCSSGSHHSSPRYADPDSELTTSGVVSSFNADSFIFESSRDCSESTSPDKPAVPLSVPSGVASFSLHHINIPDNATSAPIDMSVHNFPKRHRHVHRAAVYAMHPYHRATCRGGTSVNVTKTLDLLKAVMQSSFNQEIKKLCDDYFQIYGMAALNIHENTGDHIPPASLRLMVCKMLEEAMQGYRNNKWEFSSLQLPKNDRVSEYRGSPMSTKRPRVEKDTKHGSGKRGRKPTEKAADNRSAWKWSLDKRRLDPVKWSTDKLNTDTEFVLGVNVNKALGHAANRGKVYILHPQLFKYVCDGDDKTWLFDNKYMPVHGGKAFLMIYDEVDILTKSEENYKESNDIIKSVQNLKRFNVPNFMLNKMKDFVKHVQGFFAQESGCSSTSTGDSTSLTLSDEVK